MPTSKCHQEFLHKLHIPGWVGAYFEKQFKPQSIVVDYIPATIKTHLVLFPSLEVRSKLFFPIMVFVILCEMAFFFQGYTAKRVPCLTVGYTFTGVCLCCQLLMLSRKLHPLKGFQLNLSSRPDTFSLQGNFYHQISLEQEGFKTKKKWMRKSVIPIICQMKISPSVSLALFNYAWI